MLVIMSRYFEVDLRDGSLMQAHFTKDFDAMLARMAALDD
jgi:hypothetical protein